jgi:DNA-binding transcriptional ArsR family regulator
MVSAPASSYISPYNEIWGWASMREILSITKALADQNRLRALFALQSGELCVCQIVHFLKLAPSTVSKHMSVLRQARLIEGRKEGQWMFYRLAGAEASPEIRRALSWVCSSLGKTKEIREDAKRMGKILKIDREKFCRRKNSDKW